jgi:2-haloacid dehalogenase
MLPQERGAVRALRDSGGQLLQGEGGQEAAHRDPPSVILRLLESFRDQRIGDHGQDGPGGDDLAAARAWGLRTAYVERPLEFGAAHAKDVTRQPDNDLHARDFLHLAQQLGC